MALQQLNLFGEPENVETPAAKPITDKGLQLPENVYADVTETANDFIIDEQQVTEIPEDIQQAEVIEAAIQFEEDREEQQPEAVEMEEIIEPYKQQQQSYNSTALNLQEGKLQKKRGRKSYAEMDAEAAFVMLPADEVINKKLYHSITDVAQWFNVNPSLLRYWENEFTILKPRKTGKGDRLYNVEDIKTIQVIYYLLRTRKFSIEGAKKYLRSNRKDVDTSIQLMESLNRFKSFLQILKSNL